MKLIFSMCDVCVGQGNMQKNVHLNENIICQVVKKQGKGKRRLGSCLEPRNGDDIFIKGCQKGLSEVVTFMQSLHEVRDS